MFLNDAHQPGFHPKYFQINFLFLPGIILRDRIIHFTIIRHKNFGCITKNSKNLFFHIDFIFLPAGLSFELQF